MKPDDRANIRRIVLRLLSRYPLLSSTMIGLYIRPYIPHWRIVLDELVEEGVLARKSMAKNATGTIYAYSLAKPQTDGR